MRAGAALGHDARGVVGADAAHPRRRAVRPAAGPDPARAHPPPARSWSTATVGASPTRPPTTTPSAARSTSSTPRVRLRQPAVLAGVRPRLLPPLRVRRRHRGERPAAVDRRAGRRSPGWPTAIGVPAERSSPPSTAGTTSSPRATTTTSGAATAPTTAGPATRAAAGTPSRRSARSTSRRTTPSRSTAARLGTKGGPAHRRRRAGARPRRRADPRPLRRRQRHGVRRPGWSTAAPVARSVRRSRSATAPAEAPRRPRSGAPAREVRARAADPVDDGRPDPAVGRAAGRGGGGRGGRVPARRPARVPPGAHAGADVADGPRRPAARRHDSDPLRPARAVRSAAPSGAPCRGVRRARLDQLAARRARHRRRPPAAGPRRLRSRPRQPGGAHRRAAGCVHPVLRDRAVRSPWSFLRRGYRRPVADAERATSRGVDRRPQPRRPRQRRRAGATCG